MNFTNSFIYYIFNNRLSVGNKKEGSILKKCPKCGYDNIDSSLYCSKCGSRLSTKESNSILLIDPSATSNFVLTKKLKQENFIVKNLSNTSFAMDELAKNEYDIAVVALNLENTQDVAFLRDVKNKYGELPIMFITNSLDDKQRILAEKMNLHILEKPINFATMLYEIKNMIGAEEVQCTIYKPSEIKGVIEDNIKFDQTTYIISFCFAEFDKNRIRQSKDLLNDIYISLKRSDEFILIKDVGFIVIPRDDMNKQGIKILIDKIHDKIKGADSIFLKNFGFLQYPKNDIKIDTIVKKIIDGDVTESGNLTKQEDRTTIKTNVSVDISDEKLRDIANNRHLIFSAVSSMDDDLVAACYYDDTLKPIISPYLTISCAQRIHAMKNKKDIDIEHAKTVFKDTVSEIMHKNKLIQDKVSEQINADMSLMTLPEIQSNIIFLINEEAPFKRIIGEINKDPAITSKILKLVNSAFFGFPKQIKSLHKAVTILGTEEVLGISLSISYISSLSKNIRFVKHLWKQTIAVLAIVKFIERYAKINTYASTAAVLHNMGKMFISQYFIEDHIKILQESKKSKIAYSALELKYLSKPHTQIGYEIAELWNMPDKIKNANLYHHYPFAMSKSTYLSALHSAIIIANTLGYGIDEGSMEDLNYHSYILLKQKHNLNILQMVHNNKQDILSGIKDMMIILS